MKILGINKQKFIVFSAFKIDVIWGILTLIDVLFILSHDMFLYIRFSYTHIFLADNNEDI